LCCAEGQHPVDVEAIPGGYAHKLSAMEVMEGNAMLKQQQEKLRAQAHLVRAWAGQNLIMPLMTLWLTAASQSI